MVADDSRIETQTSSRFRFGSVKRVTVFPVETSLPGNGSGMTRSDLRRNLKSATRASRRSERGSAEVKRSARKASSRKEPLSRSEVGKRERMISLVESGTGLFAGECTMAGARYENLNSRWVDDECRQREGCGSTTASRDFSDYRRSAYRGRGFVSGADGHSGSAGTGAEGGGGISE